MEKGDFKEKEIDRRKQGKEGREIQAKFQEQQHLKDLDKQKREKEEERKHREQVRAQIEQDKLEKRARLEASKAAAGAGEPSTSPAPAAAASQPAAKADYAECRVQVCLLPPFFCFPIKRRDC